MPQDEQDGLSPVKCAVALLLTFSAGFVDVVGYITVYHTFTAHMTGTTVHFGNSLVEGHERQALIAGIVIAAFLSGSILGRVIIEVGSKTRIQRVSTFNLAIEAGLIAGFINLGSHDLPFISSASSSPPLIIGALLALLAAAMGLQTATLTRIGPLTVHTTFVTGMLNKLAQLSSHILFHTYKLLRTGEDIDRAHRRQTIRRASFMFSIWFLYLAGAVAGTWLKSVWQLHSLYIPIGAIVLAIAVDQVHPLSLQEERDQAER